MSELIGQIVQKFYATPKGIVCRGVLERKTIPWSDVKELRQIVVSPMGKSNPTAPVKFYAVRTKLDLKLPTLQLWWSAHGADKRIVPDYYEHVFDKLKDYYLLWQIEYKKPQEPDEVAQVSYLAVEPREKHIIQDVQREHKKAANHLQELIDLTYPSFYREFVAKSEDDMEAWEKLQPKSKPSLDI